MVKVEEPNIITNASEDASIIEISEIFRRQFTLPEDLFSSASPLQFVLSSTAFSDESGYLETRTFDREIEGPCLPPTIKFKIKVRVRSIRKGKLFL